MRTEPERSALTREQVVTAALELLDEAGLGGLSMRGLGDRLGVKAASLYWHLRDKEQLLDLLSEAILREVPEPEAGPWRPALEDFAARYRQVLLAHRDAARVVLGFRSGPAALRLYEPVIAKLLAAGLPPSEAADAAVLFVGQYVPAFVVDEVAAPAGSGLHGDQFGAPLEAVEWGRLVIPGGVSGLTIRADPDLHDLFAARIEGGRPRIEAEHGVVRIGGLRHGGAHSGEVALNAAVSWDVEVGGGARRLTVDLGIVRLRSFALSGGASEVTVNLGLPVGTVPVTFSGGVSRASVHRPPGTAIRVHITSGVSRLALDDLSFGSVGGETRWQSPNFAAAADRFDLVLNGGASRLTIGTGGDAIPTGVMAAEAGEARLLEGLSPAEHPSLAAVADHLVSPNMDARFRFGLQVLLDGLERRMDT